MEAIPTTLGGIGIAVADRHEFIPAMPCHRSRGFPDEPDPPHRAKIADRVFPFNALVARPVGKQEIAKTPKADLAMKSEWDRLRSKMVGGRCSPCLARSCQRGEGQRRGSQFGLPLRDMCGEEL